MTTDFEPTQFAQIVQADAKKANVNFTLKQYETATYSDIINNQRYPGVFIRSTGFGSLQPLTLFTLGSYMRPANNASGFKSDKYTQLVNDVGKEPDPAKRKSLYDQLNDVMLDEAWMYPLAGYDLAIISSNKVKGMTRSVRDTTDWVETWMTK